MRGRREGKEQRITLRLTPSDLSGLEKESKIEGLDFSSYLRHLLRTHPKRAQYQKMSLVGGAK